MGETQAGALHLTGTHILGAKESLKDMPLRFPARCRCGIPDFKARVVGTGHGH